MSNVFYIDKPLRHDLVGGDVMCGSLIDYNQEIVKTPDQSAEWNNHQKKLFLMRLK